MQIQIIVPPIPPAPDAEIPTLAETLKQFIGVLKDLPEDAASNHDHYLYGAPKKS